MSFTISMRVEIVGEFRIRLDRFRDVRDFECLSERRKAAVNV